MVNYFSLILHMGILNDKYLGSVMTTPRKYYNCRMSLSMERANATVINGIFDREYPVENMPTPWELYRDIVNVLKSIGTESLIVPSNITFVQVTQGYCGDNNFVYILEEE